MRAGCARIPGSRLAKAVFELAGEWPAAHVAQPAFFAPEVFTAAAAPYSYTCACSDILQPRTRPMTPWWQTFFDPDYVRIWEGAEATGTAERQVAGLWTILALHTGSRVHDAPCGYGRIAQVLAGRGARVVGARGEGGVRKQRGARRSGRPLCIILYAVSTETGRGGEREL